MRIRRLVIGSVLINLTLVLLVNVAQVSAQDEQVKLVWSYRTLGIVDCISVSPDYRYIAVASSSNNNYRIYLLDNTGKLVWRKSLESEVRSLSVSQNGSLAVVGFGNKIKFFDISGNYIFSQKFGHWESVIEKVEEKEIDGRKVKIESGGTYYIEDWVYSVSCSYDGELIAVAAGSKVYLFNRGGQKLWEYDIKWEPIVVVISPNGEYIVAGSYKPDNKIYIFDKYGNLLNSYKAKDSVRTIYFCSNGEHFVAGSWDGYLYAFNKTELKWKFYTGQRVVSVSFSPDCEYVILGTERGSIYLLNRSGFLIQDYKIPSKIYSASLSENGEYVVVGTRNSLYLLNKSGKTIWNYGTTWAVKGVFTYAGEIIAGSDKVYYFNYPKISAEILLSKAESTIDKIKNNFNATEALRYLRLAKECFMNSEYDKAQEYAKKSIEIANEIDRVGKRVKKIISEIEKIISSLQDKINTSDLNISLNQIKNKLTMGQYIEAKTLAERMKSELQSTYEEVVSAEISINNAKTAIMECLKFTLNSKESYNLLSQAKDYLTKAEQSFKTGNYNEAKKFAELAIELTTLAKNKSTKFNEEYLTAENTIRKAEKAIQEEESLGFDVREAKSLLYQARKLFNNGKYTEAKNLAERAYSMAVDIDQDGIPNRDDFAPLVNNNLLYILLILLSLLCVLLIFIKIKYKK